MSGFKSSIRSTHPGGPWGRPSTIGHEQVGQNLAGLYSLVATCEANGINPELYLTDVLLRIQTHPQSRIDELLPHRW